MAANFDPSKYRRAFVEYAVLLVPPLAIPKVPVISFVSETEAQVATPAPLRERTNWFVQLVPV